MQLALAQTRSVRGDWQANLEQHQRWSVAAARLGAKTIIFPELSLTGYEPSLAEQLAMPPTDDRLAPLQQIADRDLITIGVGVPTRHPNGINISLVLFHPQAARQVYSKQYLHADEEPFFVGGENVTGLMMTLPKIAIAICYELSVPAHIEQAIGEGAQSYLASVAKSATGVTQAHQRLRQLAQQHAIPTLMVNCVGPCEDFVGAGSTAIWNRRGECLAQLPTSREGLLLFDTTTERVRAEMMTTSELPDESVQNSIA